MDAHLRAGIAIFNAGGYHPAHDAWEAIWLDLESGTDDERFLHGLIQYTAAIHHAYAGNWEGLHGLAHSASDYLTGLPSPYRGVVLESIRTFLSAVARDPAHVERVRHPPLVIDGTAIMPADLDFEANAVAALVLAEEEAAYEEAVLADAVRYARAEQETARDRFTALVFDFVRDPGRRDLVYQRLRSHVDRRRGRENDVEGLFDER